MPIKQLKTHRCVGCNLEAQVVQHAWSMHLFPNHSWHIHEKFEIKMGDKADRHRWNKYALQLTRMASRTLSKTVSKAPCCTAVANWLDSDTWHCACGMRTCLLLVDCSISVMQSWVKQALAVSCAVWWPFRPLMAVSKSLTIVGTHSTCLLCRTLLRRIACRASTAVDAIVWSALWLAL